MSKVKVTVREKQIRAGLKGTELNTLHIVIVSISLDSSTKNYNSLIIYSVRLYQTCINFYSCAEHKIRYFEECG